MPFKPVQYHGIVGHKLGKTSALYNPNGLSAFLSKLTEGPSVLLPE